ncbi:MAG: hypothetical protein LBW77_06840 [Verrucomicrobiota bacterium]|jgi:glycerophosphoryl diester phosphodiesterase|nr:hypothetical protein [Verrucomicrobiota bacterium]
MMCRTGSKIFAFSLAASAAFAEPRTRFISHRGDSMNAPENTVAAFRAAAEKGADGFECDIYLTKDNEIICLHDSTAKRTAGLDAKPRDVTLAELRAQDAGGWKGPQFTGERIPTLAETLALAHDGFEIYVELKSGDMEILPRLGDALAAEPKATPERVVFICFDAKIIAALRQRFPAYRAYWLAGTGPKKDGTPGPNAESIIAAAKACDASGVDVQDSADITPAFVNTVKAAGLGFHIWTVNRAPRARELAAMGVETITSDCGSALRRALYGPPKDGRPVIHWTFDGTAKNSGTRGADGDAVPAGAPAYAEGARGQGLRLDGLDDTVSAPYQLAEQGTVALWFKPEAFYNFNTVFDNDLHADLWEMWIAGDGNLRFRIAGGSGDLTFDLNGLGGPGQWVHLAVTWDGFDTREAKLYVNGAERAAGPVTRWVAPGGTFHLGGGNPGNTRGRGVVDDVRIYEVPLAPAQVEALAAQVVRVEEDTDSLVRNPCMGWGLYDDASGEVQDADAYWAAQDAAARRYASFFYVRWRWSDMEPEEGKYAWLHNENYKKLVQGALDRGLKLCFRVYDNGQDNLRQGTPDYVRRAGAQGYTVKGAQEFWTPYADDPVFQEKLTAFVKAFAAVYDTPDTVDFVDGFNVGWWGEAHHIKLLDDTKAAAVFDWYTSLYAASFTRVIPVWCFNNQVGFDTERAIALPKGFAMRRDGLGSRWFSDKEHAIAAQVFGRTPLIGEACYWGGASDDDPYLRSETKYVFKTWRDAYEQTIKDALDGHFQTLDLREVVETRRWVSRADDLVRQFMVKGGYRLHPVEVSLPRTLTAGQSVTVAHTWRNTGNGYLPNNLANWGYKYKPAFALLDGRGTMVKHWVDEQAEPSDWLAGKDHAYAFALQAEGLPSGTYRWAVAIVDRKKGDTPGIRLAVKGRETVDGWLPLADVQVLP